MDVPTAVRPDGKIVSGHSEKSLQADFERFHADNPGVYARLRALALFAVRKGKRKIGIGMIYEVVRWEYFFDTHGDDDWKLNNNWRSRYARLLMECEPELVGIFETRELRAA
jgi:hypothetical protein